MSFVDEVLKYITSKWYVVLICAILGSGVLYVEKSQVAPSVAMTGDQLYTRLARFEPLPIATIGNGAEEIDLTDMLASKRVLNAFINDTGAQLDFEKLCTGWHNLSLLEKTTWIGKHISVTRVGVGVYEMEIQFVATDARDAAYVEENSGLMMDILGQTVEDETAAQTGNAKLVTVEEKNFVDMKEAVSQGSLQKKYAIIGFILGALVGLSVCAVLSLRRKA